MSERETIEKVKSRQSLIFKIQDLILLGKSTREDLKEFDMQLRQDFHNEINNLRRKWEEIYLEILESQQPSLNRKAKTIIQIFDRVNEQVNRATYGYAPLFNRLGQIESNELARVLNYDKEFWEYLDKLRGYEDDVEKIVETKDWKAVSDKLDNLREALDNTERRWKEREKYFRSKEM